MPPLSALGRPLDPSWPTNRAVMVLVPAAGLGAALWAALGPGGSPTDAAWTGFGWAAALFGAWALARELAPDDQGVAFAAMAAGGVVVATVPQAGLWLLFTALFQARLVNRTVGPEPTGLDALGVAGFSAVAAGATHLWAPLASASFAFLLDRRLAPAGPRRHGVLAAVCLGAAALHAWRGAAPDVARPVLDLDPALALGVGALTLFGLAIARTGPLRSPPDRGGGTLSTARVRAGMGVIAVMCAPLLVASPTLRAAALPLAVMATLGARSLVRR